MPEQQQQHHDGYRYLEQNETSSERGPRQTKGSREKSKRSASKHHYFPDPREPFRRRERGNEAPTEQRHGGYVQNQRQRCTQETRSNSLSVLGHAMPSI